MKNIFKTLKYFFSNPVVSAEYNGTTMTMTIIYQDGTIERYHGECTVWSELPYMSRCGTLKEGWLYDLWKYNTVWGGPYPTAHLTPQNNEK